MNSSLNMKSYNKKFYNFCNLNSNNDDFKFVDSIFVNSDINLYIKYLKQCDFFEMNKLISSFNRKGRIFYNNNDYKLFNNLFKAIYTIHIFLNKIKKFKNKIIINEYSLSLNKIDDNNNFLEINNNEKMYRFIASDLINIYNYSLNKISKDIYLTKKIQSPKNPYTNLPFTLKENILIYNYLSNYYLDNKKHIPNYIINFKECYFSTKRYLTRNFLFIMNKSINDYVRELSQREFLIEFLDMIDSDDELTMCYCAKCYSKINLRSIFYNTLRLFILNSNDIYYFGDYIKDFKNIAKQNNIWFTKEHVYKHRKKLRINTTSSFAIRSRLPILSTPNSLSNYIQANNRSLLNIDLGENMSNIISSEIVENVIENVIENVVESVNSTSLPSINIINTNTYSSNLSDSNILIRPNSPLNSPLNSP